MQTMSIAQTARHLGLSDSGVRKMIERGELFLLPGSSSAKLDAEAVETQRLLRRESLLLDLARRRMTPVSLAAEARRVLFPPGPDINLPQYKGEDQRRRLSLVPADARQLFGVAALAAACTEDGCRWCTAARFAEVLGGWAPDSYSAGFAALFDQAPCQQCAPRLFGTAMEALRARVHPEGTRPPEARTVATEAERRAAQEWAERRPVAAAARPVGDDDGKEMVVRRLREVRTRLKSARRSGDTQYALRLQGQLQSLTADAAAVDGRSSAGRPGTLRCGHLLAANCACPRRASKRAGS